MLRHRRKLQNQNPKFDKIIRQYNNKQKHQKNNNRFARIIACLVYNFITYLLLLLN